LEKNFLSHSYSLGFEGGSGKKGERRIERRKRVARHAKNFLAEIPLRENEAVRPFLPFYRLTPVYGEWALGYHRLSVSRRLTPVCGKGVHPVTSPGNLEPTGDKGKVFVGSSLGTANSYARRLAVYRPLFCPSPLPSHVTFQGPLAPTLGARLDFNKVK
jgi:hypothetical protein